MPDIIVSENTYDKNGLLIIEKTEDESCEEGCEKLENGMNKYSHHYDEQGNLVEIEMSFLIMSLPNIPINMLMEN